MALKTVSIGTATDVYQFDDGDTEYGLQTDGKIKVGTAPTVNDEVLRLQDIAGIVIGPAGAIDSNIAEFDGVTGFKLKDGGLTHANVADAIAKKHAESHAYSSHSDVTMAGISNDDLPQWDDPSSKWQPKSIAEVTDGQSLTPGDVIVNSKVRLTPLGGVAVRLTNKTGAASVAGQLVISNIAVDDSVILTPLAGVDCIGVFYESGIADGSEAWVVVSGIADVMFEDNHGPTRGDWVETSGSDVGTAFSQASPAAAPTHFREIGHCIETVAAGGAGTFVNARCILHFN